MLNSAKQNSPSFIAVQAIQRSNANHNIYRKIYNKILSFIL